MTRFSTTDGSSPALVTISRSGASIARRAIWMPWFWSSLMPFRPSTAVLARISTLTLLRVQWPTGGRDQRVTVRFRELPLTQALDRIIKQNYLLSRRSNPDLGATLWVSGDGQAANVEPSHALSSQGASSSESTSPVEEARRIATMERDASRRSDALSVLAGYSKTDPRAIQALSAVAATDENPQIREAAAEMLADLE